MDANCNMQGGNYSESATTVPLAQNWSQLSQHYIRPTSEPLRITAVMQLVSTEAACFTALINDVFRSAWIVFPSFLLQQRVAVMAIMQFVSTHARLRGLCLSLAFKHFKQTVHVQKHICRAVIKWYCAARVNCLIFICIFIALLCINSTFNLSNLNIYGHLSLWADTVAQLLGKKGIVVWTQKIESPWW